jgi:hypothetical protein
MFIGTRVTHLQSKLSKKSYRPISKKTKLWHNQSVKSVTFLDENVEEAKQLKEKKMETSWLDERIYMFK